MPKRYLGNIITDTPTAPAGPYENDAASGVWSLAEAFAYTKAGLWPTAGNAAPRALFAGGQDNSGSTNIIDYIEIASTGNATDFGDLDTTRENFRGAFGSSTRGVIGGGASTPDNYIQYVTIATAGNTTTFGDLLTGTTQGAGASSETRGLFGGGNNSNVIEYVTIASIGNSIDFGDLTQSRRTLAACASTTRAVFSGGQLSNSPFTSQNIIDYVTIATTGNATDFGDITLARSGLDGCSSPTRGVFAAGYDGSSNVNTIDYITIASTGNATDFGDLLAATSRSAGASSHVRGVFGGGNLFPSPPSNTIQYITIASIGNATDFGDLTVGRNEHTGLSNAHGGLAA